MGYTKLWNDLVTSSIWSADDHVRIMWITMLALADSTGFVAGSIPGLADAARLSLKDGERAIRALEAPDKYSRTSEYQGRRIEHVKDGGGWLILNYAKFRERRDLEHRRQYMRDYMKRRRAEEARKQ